MTILNRRAFLNLSIASGSGLIIGLNTSCLEQEGLSFDSNEKFSFSPFLEITEKGQIIIYAPVPEIGQGVRTSLPMILAEELEANWEKIQVVQAEANEIYGNMSAAGSESISRYYEPLRRAGATAKKMLKIAASKKWKTPLEHLETKNGFIINTENGKKLSYFKVAKPASSLPIPKDIVLKNTSEFTLLGKAKKRVDIKDIVTGKAVYGMDVTMENMKYVAVERCPIRGGNLISFDATATLNVQGVEKVIEVKPTRPISYAEVLPGIAVIATNTAAALKGKRLLKVDWDFKAKHDENDLSYRKQYDQLKNKSWEFEMRRTKDFDTLLTKDDEVFDFEYEVPFWAHYCLEPMNFTAFIKDEFGFLKGSNQRPQLIQALIAQEFGLPEEKVTVESTLAGGGFGRRLAVDYALEAAVISKQIGFPAKVIWTRDDDALHDYFRTISFHHLKVGIKESKFNSWFHHLMTKPIANGPRYEVTGAADLPFDIPNIAIGYSKFQTNIQIGSWRSVAHSFNSFVVNNTITEASIMMGKDPLETYLELIGDRETTTINLPLSGSRGEVTCDLKRMKNVLLKAAELSEWKKKTGHTAKGIAVAFYKTSYAAHVVEMSNLNGKIRLDKVTGVLDCGQVINPTDVKAQMEGSISDAITVTLKSGISISQGVPQETNFDTYPVTRITDMPSLELHVVESKEPPAGAGEPPFPSIAPAIANAYFRLTGKKVRKLPIAI